VKLLLEKILYRKKTAQVVLSIVLIVGLLLFPNGYTAHAESINSDEPTEETLGIEEIVDELRGWDEETGMPSDAYLIGGCLMNTGKLNMQNLLRAATTINTDVSGGKFNLFQFKVDPNKSDYTYQYWNPDTEETENVPYGYTIKDFANAGHEQDDLYTDFVNEEKTFRIMFKNDQMPETANPGGGGDGPQGPEFVDEPSGTYKDKLWTIPSNVTGNSTLGFSHYPGAKGELTSGDETVISVENENGYIVVDASAGSGFLGVVKIDIPDGNGNKYVGEHYIVIVKAKASAIPEVTSIEISGDNTIQAKAMTGGDATKTYTAVVKDQAGNIMSDEQVTWSLQDPYDGVSIGALTGELTVAETTKRGIVTVVATSQTVPAVKETKEVTITVEVAEPVVTSIEVSGAETIEAQAVTGVAVKEIYTAEVKDQGGNTMIGEPVIWSLQDPYEGVSIEPSTGELTVKATTSAGIVTVVATSETDPTVAGEQEVAITVEEGLKYYDITITPPINGTVITSPAGKAAAGVEVSITATPNPGYEIDSITVTDADGEVIAKENKFTMPAKAVTVTVTFKEITVLVPSVTYAPTAAVIVDKTTNVELTTVNGGDVAKVTVKSGNEAIAKAEVDIPNSKIVITGVAEGKTELTVSYDGKEYDATIAVTVSAPVEYTVKAYKGLSPLGQITVMVIIPDGTGDDYIVTYDGEPMGYLDSYDEQGSVYTKFDAPEEGKFGGDDLNTSPENPEPHYDRVTVIKKVIDQ